MFLYSRARMRFGFGRHSEGIAPGVCMVGSKVTKPPRGHFSRETRVRSRFPIPSSASAADRSQRRDNRPNNTSTGQERQRSQQETDQQLNNVFQYAHFPHASKWSEPWLTSP